MTLAHNMAPVLGSARTPTVSSPASRLAPVIPLPTATPLPRSRPRRSLRRRLTRLLLFVYGPADIGPLGPPVRPGRHAANDADPIGDRPRIRVIPVP